MDEGNPKVSLSAQLVPTGFVELDLFIPQEIRVTLNRSFCAVAEAHNDSVRAVLEFKAIGTFGFDRGWLLAGEPSDGIDSVRGLLFIERHAFENAVLGENRTIFLVYVRENTAG